MMKNIYGNDFSSLEKATYLAQGASLGNNQITVSVLKGRQINISVALTGLISEL